MRRILDARFRSTKQMARALLIIAVLLSALPLSAAIPAFGEGVIATLQVGSKPSGVAVEPNVNRVYVAIEDGNSVSVIDGASSAVVASVAVGARPQAIAANPETKRVYVANFAGNSVSVIDTTNTTVAATIPVAQPFILAVNPATNRVYVAGVSPDSVSVIDGNSNSITGAIGFPGAAITGLVVNPGTNRVYVSTGGVSGTLTVIDGSSNAIVATQPGGSHASVKAANQTLNRIYATQSQGEGFDVLDGTSNAFVTSVKASMTFGTFGAAANPANNRVYVAAAGPDVKNLMVVDGATNTLLSTIGGVGGFGEVAVDPVNGRVYVTDPDAGTVSVIDPSGAPSPAPVPTPAPVPPAPGAMDYDVTNGHFYQQANGQGGAGNTGFAVTNDNGIEFWNWFNRFGGVHAVGYPVSHRFQWKGLTVQAFQKVVFQWHPESRSVQFVNVFDELSAAGKDDWLASVQMTPHGFNWSGDAGRPWDYVVASHLAVLDQYPALKAEFFNAGDPVTMNGLPMAVQDFGNAIVLRAQRKVYQQWKIDVPWARAGQVTVANGGDVGKAAGLYPQEAITPLRYGVTPTPAPEPCGPAPLFNGFDASPGTVNPGQRVVLSWGYVNYASSVSIDNGIGGVPTPGSREVYPGSTTTYVMTAVGPCGTSRALRVTVSVNSQPQPTPIPTPVPQPIPSVQQVSPPNGFIERQGTSVTLTWNPATMPGSPNYVYGIEVEQGFGNFWNGYASQRVSDTSFNLSNLGVDFRGHWRVWAIDPSSGAEGPKSGWWDFSISLLPQ